MNTAATHGHLFWVTSRAAGIAALLFASAAAGLGLTASMKLLKGPRRVAARRQLPEPERRRPHDPLHQRLTQPWVSIGIVAGWALLILGLSYYARRRIGAARWRRLHRLDLRRLDRRRRARPR